MFLNPYYIYWSFNLFVVKKVKNDDTEWPDSLEWPEEYTLKATRMSLTDNVIENYEIW